MTTSEEYFTDSPIHPGEYLRDFIKEIKITSKQLAQQLEIDEQTLRAILDGKSPITSPIAERLGDISEIPAWFWNRLQIHYDTNREYNLWRRRHE